MHGVTERKLQVPTEVLLDVGNPIRNNPHQSPNSLYGWYEYKPSRNGEMVGFWHWIAHKLFFKRSQALNTIAQLGAWPWQLTSLDQRQQDDESWTLCQCIILPVLHWSFHIASSQLVSTPNFLCSFASPHIFEFWEDIIAKKGPVFLFCFLILYVSIVSRTTSPCLRIGFGVTSKVWKCCRGKAPVQIFGINPWKIQGTLGSLTNQQFSQHGDRMLEISWGYFWWDSMEYQHGILVDIGWSILISSNMAGCWQIPFSRWAIFLRARFEKPGGYGWLWSHHVASIFPRKIQSSCELRPEFPNKKRWDPKWIYINDWFWCVSSCVLWEKITYQDLPKFQIRVEQLPVQFSNMFCELFSDWFKCTMYLKCFHLFFIQHMPNWIGGLTERTWKPLESHRIS